MKKSRNLIFIPLLFTSSSFAPFFISFSASASNLCELLSHKLLLFAIAILFLFSFPSNLPLFTSTNAAAAYIALIYEKKISFALQMRLKNILCIRKYS